MPTYEYRCGKCGHSFEKIMSLSQHAQKATSPCPKCNSRRVEQVPSQFQAVTAKKT